MKTNTQIKGDLSVCCDTTLAGRCTALSNATIKGSLKVEGWLDARNLKQPCKGLYPSEEALARAYPHPLPGWWALVGDSVPAEIYIVDDRRWVDSGNIGGNATIDLTVYDQAIENTNGRINDLSTQIEELEHPVAVEDTTAADLILADAAGNAIATFAGGHIRTANFNSANITANSSASSGSSDSDSDSSSGSTTSATGKITLTGKWCTLGDSITRQDYDKTDGLRGYQTWVKKQITFSGGYSNLGVNGWTMQHQALALDAIKAADYFTIAFGSNDWLAAQEIGTIDDYKDDTGTNTMFGSARKIINKIRQLNIDAKIIMCTPRKCYNPTYTGATWEAPNSRGATLAQYAEAIRQIAQYESFPIADFFSESSTNQANLAALSITTDGDGIAVHPNTQGHKLLAGILIQKFLYFTQV